MSYHVKGFLKDLTGASRVTKARLNTIQSGSAVPDPKDPIRELADKLHPASMEFVVESVRLASPTSRTYRLKSADGHIPVFQAGQYVNFRLRIGGSELTRPYTISSAPCEALGKDGYFEVIIRRNRRSVGAPRS